MRRWAALVGLISVVLACWPTVGLSKGAPVSREVTPRGPLSDGELRTIKLFEAASPSVVYITTSEVYRDFFSRRATEVPRGSGTGFLWDARGHVVTNFHVIAGGRRVTVTLNDQTSLQARVVGVAPDKDLAVVKVEGLPSGLTPIALGRSADLKVGQMALAIGNPFGLDQTLTTGVISALNRTITAVTGRTIQGVIQTDAAINPGNSGGPLLDSAGRLIGVNTAIQSPSGASAGIGFAVPVDTVNRVVPQLIAYGEFKRPTLGIEGDDRLAARLGVEGVLVLQVFRNGAAARAGLRPTRRALGGRVELGDVIIRVGQRPTGSLDELLGALEAHNPGDTVEITVLRDRQPVKVQVTLDAAR